MTNGLRVGVVGAATIVGREVAKLFSSGSIPLSEFRPLGSSMVVGARMSVAGFRPEIQPIDESAFADLDLIVFAAGRPMSAQWIPDALKSDAVVVDLSSEYRFDEDVPLVIAGLNDAAIESGRHNLLALPSPVAFAVSKIVSALSTEREVHRVTGSTYQAVSGSGARAADGLTGEVADMLSGRQPHRSVYGQPLAFNCIPRCGELSESGESSVEKRVRDEVRRVVGNPDLRVLLTCVRVPMFHGYGLSLFVELDEPLRAARARQLLTQLSDVDVVDDPEDGIFPTPRSSLARPSIQVGRISAHRDDPTVLRLFACLDDQRVGKALAAVRVAESLWERRG